MTDRDIIPVLIACPADWTLPVELGGKGRAADGYLFSGEGGNVVPVRVLSWDFFRLKHGSTLPFPSRMKRWELLCKAYGVKVSAKESAALLALFRLSQAVQAGGFRFQTEKDASGRTQLRVSAQKDLHIYVKLQAEIRAQEKRPVPSSPPEYWSKSETQEKEVWNELLPSEGGHPVFELAQQVNRRAATGRLMLWFAPQEEKLRAGLYFARIQDAVYALYALQTGQPEGIGICERCGNVFKRARVEQKFCSVKCGNYVRKKRERAVKNR